jgi:uncharacterized protein
MLVILNSSKTLNLEPCVIQQYTIPLFLDKAQELVTKYLGYNAGDLQKELHTSDSIATLTQQRLASWTMNHTLKNAKQAICTFTGSVFRDINVANYSTTELDYLQSNCCILSGLYGILRPLDLIQAYRLEMVLSEHFWKQHISEYVENHHERVIINLSSKEYFKPISSSKRVITPVFKELKNGEYKVIAIYAKFARGCMTNWIIQNQIKDVEQLRRFDLNGYKHSDTLSTRNNLVFIREGTHKDA